MSKTIRRSLDAHQGSWPLRIFRLQLHSAGTGRRPSGPYCVWICRRRWDDKTESWTNEKTDAHAGAEVFDGNQWIRVEATPPETIRAKAKNRNKIQQRPTRRQPGSQQRRSDPNNPNNQPGDQQGDQPTDEDRDEGDLPPELLETLRQAERLLDALKTDEKPLSAIEAEKGQPSLRIRRPKKDW